VAQIIAEAPDLAEQSLKDAQEKLAERGYRWAGTHQKIPLQKFTSASRI
jgi:hypothetical protein